MYQTSAVNVSDLLDSLREHGTIDSEGQFTVSLSQARRKLTQYHSSNRARYLLMLVSAGLASGANEVHFRQDGRGYSVEMPNAYIPEDSLIGCFQEQIQEQDTAAGALDLVLGVQSAFAEGATQIGVVVEHPSKPSFRWTLTPDSEQTIPMPASAQAKLSLEFVFVESWREKLSAFLRSLGGYVGQREEARLLEQFCDRSLVPIRLENELLNRPYYLPESVAYAQVNMTDEKSPRFTYPFEGREWCGKLALQKSGGVQLVVHGVSYCLVEDCGLEGVVHHPGLRRDISREKIVCDATYQGLLEELEEIRTALLRATPPELHEFPNSLVKSVLPDIVALALDGLSLSDLEGLQSWMRERLAAPGSSAPDPALETLRLYSRLRKVGSFSDMPAQTELLLSTCARAFKQRRANLRELVEATVMIVEIEEPTETLVPGYLRLGLGAYLSHLGQEKEAQSHWMEALDTVRRGDDDRAEELVHAHMDFEVEHIMDQVSTALVMHSRS